MGTKPKWVEMRGKYPSAARLLREFDMNEPPVPIFELAQRLDVELYEVKNAPWEGAIDKDEREGWAKIYFSAESHIHRQRFTVAHEIGHLILHEGRQFRDNQFETDKPQEAQANGYAAKLLMPTWMVLVLVKNFGEDITKLAKMFKVSQGAMKFRLINMRERGKL